MTGRNETAYLECVAIPDATTPLEFRHLPETMKPGEQVFACVSAALLSSILF